MQEYVIQLHNSPLAVQIITTISLIGFIVVILLYSVRYYNKLQLRKQRSKYLEDVRLQREAEQWLRELYSEARIRTANDRPARTSLNTEKDND